MCVYYDEFSKKMPSYFFTYFEEQVPFYFVGVLEIRYALAMEEKSKTVYTLTAIGDLYIKLDFCSVHTNKVFQSFPNACSKKEKEKKKKIIFKRFTKLFFFLHPVNHVFLLPSFLQ